MTKPENETPPVATTTEGKPSTVEATDNRSIAHRRATRNAKVAYRSEAGAVWRYRGKRAVALEMLATMPGGVTQWDTLPWHTRLGGTVHALREAGLAIDTEREGEFRHARYRLRTPGSLLIQPKNREASQ